LDLDEEDLTPSDYGLEMAFGIGKPFPPEIGSLKVNIVKFDYDELPKNQSKNST
jgi:hypothetical protein